MSREQEYIAHVEKSFENAEKGISKLPQEILDMEGMTGIKTRHFYNNLLELLDARYLECGVWKGSSVCSAMFGNKAILCAIDNFSSFGGPKDEFLANFNKYSVGNDAVSYEKDCFDFDPELIFNAPVNIFLADVDHSEDSERRVVTHFLPAMADVFILIKDDWNWQEVRLGTQKAIEEANLKVLYHKEIRTTHNNQFPDDQEMAKNTWWNGTAVFILKKP